VTNYAKSTVFKFVPGHGTVVQSGSINILFGYKQAQQYSRTHQLGFIGAVSWCAQNAESHWSHVHISVEHDPVYGSRSNRILQFRTGSRSDWFPKNINRIRYGYPNCIDHCSLMLDQRFLSDINRIGSNIWRGLPD